MSGGVRAGAGVAAHRSLRVRRACAGAAVAALVVIDLWTAVAGAQDEGPHPAGSPTLGTGAGTGAEAHPAALAAVDSAESVPSGALGAPTPMTTPTGSGTAPTGTTPVVVERGDGTFTVLPVPAIATSGAATSGRLVRYTVETEGGLGVDGAAYADTVTTVLTDARGWQPTDGVRFVNVTPAEAASGTKPDLRITLASPATTDRLCAPLETRGRVSCHNGGRVVLNARRWLLGAEAYGKDVNAYRIYLVNHEVGHGIGHGHEKCGGAGQVAPVMMQQTYGLDGCTAWPWPSAKPA